MKIQLRLKNFVVLYTTVTKQALKGGWSEKFNFTKIFAYDRGCGRWASFFMFMLIFKIRKVCVLKLLFLCDQVELADWPTLMRHNQLCQPSDQYFQLCDQLDRSINLVTTKCGCFPAQVRPQLGIINILLLFIVYTSNKTQISVKYIY